VQGVTTDHIPFTGYEMHMGINPRRGQARRSPGLLTDAEGAVSADGRVIAPIFTACSPTIGSVRPGWHASPPVPDRYEALVEQTLDRVAAHIAAHVDLDRLFNFVTVMSRANKATTPNQQCVGAR